MLFQRLQNLTIENKEVKSNVSLADADNVIDNGNYNVIKIVDHKQQGNDFSFLCKTKNEIFWSDDSDCSCESLIQEYFRKNKMNIRTIYCWCRVSTKKQAEDNHCSLDLQRETLVDFAYNNYSSRDRIKVCELSQTAYTKQSRELNDIVNNCSENDIILCYSIDRFTRNFELIMELLIQISRKGVTLHSVKENITYTDETKSEFFTKVLHAQLESANIGKRIRSALAFKKSQLEKNGTGKWVGRRVPYGYRRVTQTDVSMNDEEQKNMQTVRNMFAKNKSVFKICQELNQKGMFRRKQRWTQAQVSNAIKTCDTNKLYNMIIEMVRQEIPFATIAKTLNSKAIFWVAQLWNGDLVKRFLERELPFRSERSNEQRNAPRNDDERN